MLALHEMYVSISMLDMYLVKNAQYFVALITLVCNEMEFLAGDS